MEECHLCWIDWLWVDKKNEMKFDFGDFCSALFCGCRFLCPNETMSSRLWLIFSAKGRNINYFVDSDRRHYIPRQSAFRSFVVSFCILHFAERLNHFRLFSSLAFLLPALLGIYVRCVGGGRRQIFTTITIFVHILRFGWTSRQNYQRCKILTHFQNHLLPRKHLAKKGGNQQRMNANEIPNCTLGYCWHRLSDIRIDRQIGCGATLWQQNDQCAPNRFTRFQIEICARNTHLDGCQQIQCEETTSETAKTAQIGGRRGR